MNRPQKNPPEPVDEPMNIRSEYKHGRRCVTCGQLTEPIPDPALLGRNMVSALISFCHNRAGVESKIVSGDALIITIDKSVHDRAAETAATIKAVAGKPYGVTGNSEYIKIHYQIEE